MKSPTALHHVDSEDEEEQYEDDSPIKTDND